MAACGPGPIPANSMTRTPDSGPGRAASGFMFSGTLLMRPIRSLRAAQKGARHDLEHDFVRTSVDALHARVGPRARDRILGHVAVTAVELDAQVAGAALQLGHPAARARAPSEARVIERRIDHGRRDQHAVDAVLLDRLQHL